MASAAPAPTPVTKSADLMVKIENGIGAAASVLAIAGALNWGSIVFLKRDIVNDVFKSHPGSKGPMIIKGAVGISGVILASVLISKIIRAELARRDAKKAGIAIA
jgi:uncharacterized membrane protein YuzA (DUF378 family)